MRRAATEARGAWSICTSTARSTALDTSQRRPVVSPICLVRVRMHHHRSHDHTLL